MGCSTVIVATALLALVAGSAGAADPPVPRNDRQLDGTRADATPAERPLRPFAGWLPVSGCKFRADGAFVGRVQDGTISGTAAEATNFNWPIAADGRFAGRIVLAVNAEGGRVHQWVDGRVEADRLVVNVAFGVPGQPHSVCRSAGLTLQLGG